MSSRDEYVLDELGINRNILECKCRIRMVGPYGRLCINRNILECK